ncbi:MAG: NAD(P)-dependent oxidoreductase [Polyangia bacterium]
MRILLTGASGYIGLHIVRELLEDGHELTALVRSPGKLGPFASAPGLRVVEADLEQEARVPQALEGHEVCVHAALIWGEPGTELELRDTAVAAKLFTTAGSAGVARCIFISSAAVHRPFTGEMGEEDRISTTDLYGATKAAGELFLRAACAESRMTGIVLRPGPVVGPPAFAGGSFRSDSRIAAMVTAAVDGRSIDVVRGEGRQFTDVTMFARVTRLLIRAAAPHPTYVCVDREILTWERIAEMVVEGTGSRSPVNLVEPDAPTPVPRFRTDRLEGLLGGPADARDAMKAHIAHLAAAKVGA